MKAVELGLLSVAALQGETQAEAVLVVQRMVELGREIAGIEGHRGGDLVVLDAARQIGQRDVFEQLGGDWVDAIGRHDIAGERQMADGIVEHNWSGNRGLGKVTAALIRVGHGIEVGVRVLAAQGGETEEEDGLGAARERAAGGSANTALRVAWLVQGLAAERVRTGIECRVAEGIQNVASNLVPLLGGAEAAHRVAQGLLLLRLLGGFLGAFFAGREGAFRLLRFRGDRLILVQLVEEVLLLDGLQSAAEASVHQEGFVDVGAAHRLGSGRSHGCFHLLFDLRLAVILLPHIHRLESGGGRRGGGFGNAPSL
ncbi:MAG: hypothetical protein ABSH44_20345 [Bryobacteraceae bacterium]